ncbi:MAG TPA: amidohydrolase [Casimicrobiaceae bacterium]|nr:amidohydrolase [Casimicrobiaceae bacterium]
MDTMFINGRISTLDPAKPAVTAVAVSDGLVGAVGDDRDVMTLRSPSTTIVDLRGRTVVPGLNDSHTHLIRGGLNYNLELRWDGVESLADALRMLREQARRTPAPQWVRVVGGWSEFQFAERRMPTLDEINAAAPETPVFVLHLYDRALLNAAAVRAVGYTKETPDFPGGVIERDGHGNPTGILIASPNAAILYGTLAKGPRLPAEYQLSSTRHFMRELNRLGITSVIDAGGGSQNYPEDYEIVDQLHRNGELTVRIAYNLFTQKPNAELADFQRWTSNTSPGRGDAMYRLNGAGEMLVYSAADFEDFLQPRPDMPVTMEEGLYPVVRLLAEKRWPFRLHATYDQTIARALDVFERVNHEIPFAGLHWMFDHAETITPRNIERVRALGGGIAIQHRMAYQGEHFVARYGAKAAEAAPPIRRMLDLGVPVGAGTDATRVASYNPWITLYWLTTGRTVGGLRVSADSARLDRTTALRLWTEGSAWFSSDDTRKGRLAVGQFADLCALDADYFTVADEDIKSIESVLTVVGGRIVHAAQEFVDLAPPLPPAMPDWSPVRAYGGYQRASTEKTHVLHCDAHGHAHAMPAVLPIRPGDRSAFFGALGCSCFAF